jgi:hypothetical protein
MQFASESNSVVSWLTYWMQQQAAAGYTPLAIVNHPLIRRNFSEYFHRHSRVLPRPLHDRSPADTTRLFEKRQQQAYEMIESARAGFSRRSTRLNKRATPLPHLVSTRVVRATRETGSEAAAAAASIYVERKNATPR